MCLLFIKNYQSTDFAVILAWKYGTVSEALSVDAGRVSEKRWVFKDLQYT